VGVVGLHEVSLFDVSDPAAVPIPPRRVGTGAPSNRPVGVAVSTADAIAVVVDGDPTRVYVIDLFGGAAMVGSESAPGAFSVIAVQP